MPKKPAEGKPEEGKPAEKPESKTRNSAGSYLEADVSYSKTAITVPQLRDTGGLGLIAKADVKADAKATVKPSSKAVASKAASSKAASKDIKAEIVCPDWVPEDKRKDFVRVLSDADEFYTVLESDYEISGYQYDEGILSLELRRGSIRGWIELGKIPYIKSITLDGTKAILYYSEEAPKPKLDLKVVAISAGGGFITGVIVMVIFVIVL